MKVKVIQDKCIGCGACVAIAPLNFDFDENGLSTVIAEEITEKTMEAKEACPVYAIEIEEAKETAEKSVACESEECACGDECDCGNHCKCDEGCEAEGNCDCDENCNCDEEENLEEAA